MHAGLHLLVHLPGKARLPQLSVEEQRLFFESAVLSAVQTLLGGAVGVNDPLVDSGLDSLGAVELRNSVASSAGIDLPSTLVFDYPTVSAITGFLLSSVKVSDSVVPEESTGFDGGAVESVDEIGFAIDCVSGITSATIGNFQDGVSEVPFSYWDVDSPSFQVR